MVKTPLIQRLDAIEGLKKLKDNSVDLIVTDPPYNIASKQKRTMRGGVSLTTSEAWGEWDMMHPFDYDLMILQVLTQAYRVLRPGGALYMFTANEDSGHFIRKAIERGFTYRNQIMLIKRNPLPSIFKTQWRSAFEVCMYLTKGRIGTFNFISQAECVNIFEYAVAKKETRHPTEKPLELIKRIIRISSKPDDLVVDPFVGSGTTAVAAKALGRRFLGFDTKPEYVRMARRRLKKA